MSAPTTLPAPPVDGLSEHHRHVTGEWIASNQLASGEIPWETGQHTDPWNHGEAAMGLLLAGFRAEAEGAWEWLQDTQRPDGTWPQRLSGGVTQDPSTDTNFTAYIATGLLHHHCVTGDELFASALFTTVRRALDAVCAQQRPDGTIPWVANPNTTAEDAALLTGASSIARSLACGLRLAAVLGQDQPHWETARKQVCAAIRRGVATPGVFAAKRRYAMDWYYPVLSGAFTAPQARRMLRARWGEFVVDGLGARCVTSDPWVTVAESCELAIALAVSGDRAAARDVLAWQRFQRRDDGAYWTGFVYPDDAVWPVETTTWTAGAVLLADDVVTGRTPGSTLFDLPGKRGRG